MANKAFCGNDCDNCSYKKDLRCVTCRVGRGHVCHGLCEAALCVIERKLDDCQQCADYPCRKFLVTRTY